MADIAILTLFAISYNTLSFLLTSDKVVSPDLCLQVSLPEGLCTFNEKGSVFGFLSLPFRIGIIVASISLSILLLAVEWWKARKVIKSQDISYSITNGVSYRYYSIQSYARFCFFQVFN